MILTLISPSGERWSLDPAPQNALELAAWLATLPVDQKPAALALVLLRDQRTLPPKGKSLLAHTRTGWQAILSNP